ADRDGFAPLVDPLMLELHDPGVLARLAAPFRLPDRARPQRVPVEDRFRKPNIPHPEIGNSRPKRRLADADPDDQTEGKQAVHKTLAELGLFGEFFVQMQRLRVHRQCAEEHIVHFSDGAAERDLETRLDWIGSDHNNTDNPHVHILIRGRDEHGQKLEIASEYVKSGIRARSQEIVQRELGLRPEREVVAAREKVIDQRRWTDLDWSIKQRSGRDSKVSYHGDWNALSERQRERYGQEVRRLRALERLGLASERGEMTWELKRDWERELRRMQR